MNRRLIGTEDWAERVRDEIEDMRLANFAAELAKLKKRRRVTEMQARIAEGPRDPWRATRHGPLREIILTANRKWLEAFDTESIDDLFGDRREDRFEALAKSWLTAQFGEDVVHARADLDEEAYHIHAVIVPRATTRDGRRMLQPSKHEMIRDYEKAQDSVGTWFADLGLVRGEKRAAAIRKARQENAARRADEPKQDVPKHRQHVSPRDWRRQQEAELADRERCITARESDADTVISIARSVARGETEVAEIDESRAAGPRERAARKLFGRVLDRLSERARQGARAELESAFNQIRAADTALVEAARHLSRQARTGIAAARPPIAAAIARLPSLLQRRDRREDRDPRD
ncbi:hypothetical protein [Mameliella sp. MMSF_3537]|uniref:hypothetical protein n=1 Tax=Mameliella sp. MMSF_3537 TaxID=3046721 RepID=UPI00273F01DB|nr:hypothetical protein [Mameliella sp. MMSF_3537]